MSTTEFGSIYVITCIPTGKKYVGLTVQTLANRFAQHLRRCNNYKTCPKLGYAINKYGRDAFIVEELERCSLASLGEREIFWIDKLNTFRDGLNLTSGGWVSNKLEQTRLKMSRSQRGKKLSEETRRKMSLTRTGFRHTEESKQKMSRVQKGRTFSPETIEKMRAAALRRCERERTLRCPA